MALGDDVRVSVPGISWVKSDVGDSFTAIILPQWDRTGREVLTIETQQTDMSTREPKFFADGSPRMQDFFLLQTEFRKFEMVSKDYLATAREEGYDDNGERRICIKAYSTRPARMALAAFKRAHGRIPGAGDYVKVTNFSESAGPDGKGRITKLAFAPGTEATFAQAEEYRRTNKPTVVAPVVAAPVDPMVSEGPVFAEPDDDMMPVF